MPNVLNAFGAGLKDASVKNAAGDDFDIYGVVTVEGNSTREETEVRGDDQLLGTFGSSLREELSIESNAISLDVIREITGNALTHVTGASAKIALGTDNELNPVFVQVSAYTNLKLKTGESATLKKTWHKVQINNITLSQAGEQEFKVTLEGVALQTDTDIEGDAFTPTGNRVATVEITKDAQLNIGESYE